MLYGSQDDLKQFELSEDQDEEFYAGGGQIKRQNSEHFPQLWCPTDYFSVYGQVRVSLLQEPFPCKPCMCAIFLCC